MALRTVLACCLMAVPLLGFQGESALDEVILPKKSDIFISLQRAINSKTAKPGDKFSAIVEVPVTINDTIVIPVGSYVIGHVSDSKGAGYFKGKAELLLAFDTVILPQGTTRQMVAYVESADRYRTDPASEDGNLKAEGSQAEEVAVSAAKGAVTGMITGATIGILRNGGAARGIGIGSAVGAAGGALLGLLKKGEEVELPKGTSLTIQLQEAVQFVKPAPVSRGTSLKP